MNLRHLIGKLLPSWSSDRKSPSAGSPRALGGVELLEARVVLSVAAHSVEYTDRDWEVVRGGEQALFLSDRQAFGPTSSSGPSFNHPPALTESRWSSFSGESLARAEANDFAHGNERRVADPYRPAPRETVFALPVPTFQISTVSIAIPTTLDSAGFTALGSDLTAGALRSNPSSSLLVSGHQAEGEFSHPFVSIVITTIRVPVFTSVVSSGPGNSYATVNSPRLLELSALQSQRLVGNSSNVQSLLGADDSSTSGSTTGEVTARLEINPSLHSSSGTTPSRLSHRPNIVITSVDRGESLPSDQGLSAKAESADDSDGLIELTAGAESLPGKRKIARNKPLREQAAIIDGSLHSLSAALLANDGSMVDRTPLHWPSQDAASVVPATPNIWSPEQAGLIELLAADLAQLIEPASGVVKQNHAAFSVLSGTGLETASDSYRAFELAASEGIAVAREPQATGPREDQFVSSETHVE